MDIASLYQSKLTTPDHAMTAVPSGSKLSMGMAMAEPPAHRDRPIRRLARPLIAAITGLYVQSRFSH
ncbi:MAG TPA: hypothetical protein VFE60_15185 [Roseiarcus sp.]|jgi:itaconate CoA-transferase|nr:hypothetical protein [Roseiarcus sp.]